MWFPRDAGEGAFPHDPGKGCFLKGPGELVLSQGTREKGVFKGPWKMVFRANTCDVRNKCLSCPLGECERGK